MSKFENIIIEPYVGALPLKFGMKVQEVIELIGAPGAKKQSKFGLVFNYDGFNVMFSTKGIVEVEEVGFTRYFPKVLLDGETLFGYRYDADTYTKLLKYDKNPFKTDGGVLVFEKLGISLTGYSEDIPDSRALTCFVKGLWDFAIK